MKGSHFVWSILAVTLIIIPYFSRDASAKSVQPVPSTFQELIQLTPEELDHCDVARMNLLCAEGLKGSEKINIKKCLSVLDELAEYVKKRTTELSPKFESNPKAFRNSKSFYKMTVLVTVIQKEKNIIYNPKIAIRPGTGYDQTLQQMMPTDSKNLFIHGLLDEPKLGTCASMPVLWASIGRRLGYPIKLVHAKNHLFARWEDGKEHFNIEASEGVMASPKDEEYKTWPFPLNDEEIKKGPYLKSLTSAEELADFLNSRYYCLIRAGRKTEASTCALKVKKLVPNASKYEFEKLIKIEP